MSDAVTTLSVSAQSDTGVAEAPMTAPEPEVPEPSPVPTPAPAPAPEIPEPQPDTVPQPSQPQPAHSPETAVSSQPIPAIKSYLSRALEKIQFRKRAKLDKILVLAAKKKSIKNDDVEKLLKVSDATASRYLAQLVKEGRLRRVGALKQPTYQPV